MRYSPLKGRILYFNLLSRDCRSQSVDSLSSLFNAIVSVTYVLIKGLSEAPSYRGRRNSERSSLGHRMYHYVDQYIVDNICTIVVAPGTEHVGPTVNQ